MFTIGFKSGCCLLLFFTSTVFANCFIFEEYSTNPIGRVEVSGKIHAHAFAYMPIGYVDYVGKIYINPYGQGSPVGRVDTNGLIHDSAVSYHPVGRVDASFRIHDSPYGFSQVGHAVNCSLRQAGGGAFLLLFY